MQLRGQALQPAVTRPGTLPTRPLPPAAERRRGRDTSTFHPSVSRLVLKLLHSTPSCLSGPGTTLGGASLAFLRPPPQSTWGACTAILLVYVRPQTDWSASAGLGGRLTCCRGVTLPPRVAALPARTNRSCHPSCGCLRACCGIFARRRGVMWGGRAGEAPLVRTAREAEAGASSASHQLRGCGPSCSLTLKSRLLHKDATISQHQATNQSTTTKLLVCGHPGPSALLPPSPAGCGRRRQRSARSVPRVELQGKVV